MIHFNYLRGSIVLLDCRSLDVSLGPVVSLSKTVVPVGSIYPSRTSECPLDESDFLHIFKTKK